MEPTLNDEQLSILLHAKRELENILREIQQGQESNSEDPPPSIERQLFRLLDTQSRFEEICALLEDQDLATLNDLLPHGAGN
jgi:hypothetical protein